MTMRTHASEDAAIRSYETRKRVFDIIMATLALATLAPLLALIAIAVKVDSRGPVFYRGVRSGKGGVPFKIFKFRTMVENAESVGGMSTAKNDPRVTRVGAFLRRFKLDELPQFINVLVGEMSIVGPRPEMPAYTALYDGEERLILTVRPGITDFASLQFSQLDEVLGEDDADRVYETRVRPVKNALRVKYVKERNLLLDIKLIVATAAKLAGSVVSRALR